MRLFSVRMRPGLGRAVIPTYCLSAARPSTPPQFSSFERKERWSSTVVPQVAIAQPARLPGEQARTSSRAQSRAQNTTAG